MKWRSFFVVGLILAFSVLGKAQAPSTMVGTVTDPSGAVIPEVQVTAIEVGTGFNRSATTDASGYYVITSLRPTNYTLTVRKEGFRPYTQAGITLLANQTLTASVQLVLGTTSQQVLVTGAPPQVDTYTPTLAQVVDQKRTLELPLNGRNAASLTTLVAGVAPDQGGDVDQGTTKTFPVAVPISTNGARQDQVAFLLDGADNVDLYTNVNLPFPFPDALQEFSIQTANYGAEFGSNAGGVVNVVTKSGTNSLHGDLFEFVRNQVFNARNFFAADRDQLKRNQFGGTVGGPITIPGLYKGKDRTFFFFGYQGTEIRNVSSTGHAFIPTQAEMNGDFSAFLSATDPNNPVGKVQQLTNPATGQPFTGNQIDPSTYDHAAVTYITKYFPQATGTGLVYYSKPFSQGYREFLTRVDHSIGTKDQVFFRYYTNRFANRAFFVNNNMLTDTPGSTILSQSYTLHETHSFRSTLLNDFGFSYLRDASQRGPADGVPNTVDLGINIWAPGQHTGIQGMSVSGYFSPSNFAFAKFTRNAYQWTDNLRWVHGGHNMAFGGSVERSHMDIVNVSNEGGAFSFNGHATGNAIADFLLGEIRTFNQNNGMPERDRATFYGFYAQDTYHASKRLTLTGGLRWEPWTPWVEIMGKTELFRPNAFYAGTLSKVYTNAPPGLSFLGDAGFPGPGGMRSSMDQFAPRVGFAYDLSGDGKTSLRGGAGVFFDTHVNANTNQGWSGASPWSISETLTNPAGPLSNPYLGITNPFPTPFPVPADIQFPLPLAAYTFDPSGRYKVPTIYNWNLTLERQLRSDWMVRATYVGSHGSNIVEGIDWNPAVYIPGSDLGPDDRRLFANYSDIYYDSQVVNSNYNSLQLTLEKRFTRDLTILANYTYSKSLDTLPAGAGVSGVPNGNFSPVPWYMPGFHQMDYGPSEFDRTHNFVLSYVWKTPALAGQNRLVRGIVGNWEWSGIVSAYTGDPITIFAGDDFSQTAMDGDRAVLLSGNRHISGACANAAPCMNWINPSAFGLPDIGTWGNVGKGSVRGPGLFGWDMGLFKNIPLNERFNVQFRAEFFNVFNHTQLSDPDNAAVDPSFGQILSAGSPRIGQFALKLFF